MIASSSVKNCMKWGGDMLASVTGLSYRDSVLLFAHELGFIRVVRDNVRYFLLDDIVSYYGENMREQNIEHKNLDSIIATYDIWGCILQLKVEIKKEKSFVWTILRMLHLVFPKADLSLKITEKGIDSEKQYGYFREEVLPFSGGIEYRCVALGRVALSKDQVIRIIYRLNELQENHERWAYTD